MNLSSSSVNAPFWRSLWHSANLFKIYGEYKSYSYLVDGSGAGRRHTVHWQLCEDYRGKITPEKIERLLAVCQPLLEATTGYDRMHSGRNLPDKYSVMSAENCRRCVRRAK
jgi:hypothetical protein